MPSSQSPVSEPPASRPPILVEVRRDEILTGEAVALDVQPLGFFLRALGVILDLLIGAFLYGCAQLAASWLALQGAIDSSTFTIVSIGIAVLVMVALPTTVETATRGRSIGKLAVGGRIVRADGGAAGFRQAFIRALTGVLELWLTLGAIAALVGAFTPQSQRLGDLLAGTYSERTRTPPLPPSASGVPPVLAVWAATADVARLPDRLARRCAQFVAQADGLQPAARTRLSAALATEVTPYVAPIPAVDAETLVRAVVAVRRDREFQALTAETAAVDRLTAGTSGIPRGFPERGRL